MKSRETPSAPTRAPDAGREHGLSGACTANTGRWSNASCPGRSRRRASASNTANSPSLRAVPTCSRTTSRPARRSAIRTLVLPERPGDFRTNTTSPTLPTSGVCHPDHDQRPDQHLCRQRRALSVKWHESGDRSDAPGASSLRRAGHTRGASLSTDLTICGTDRLEVSCPPPRPNRHLQDRLVQQSPRSPEF